VCNTSGWIRRKLEEIHHKGYLGFKDLSKSCRAKGRGFGGSSGIDGNIGNRKGSCYHCQGVVVGRNIFPFVVREGSRVGAQFSKQEGKE
jgi:hypothetical protein